MNSVEDFATAEKRFDTHEGKEDETMLSGYCYPLNLVGKGKQQGDPASIEYEIARNIKQHIQAKSSMQRAIHVIPLYRPGIVVRIYAESKPADLIGVSDD